MAGFPLRSHLRIPKFWTCERIESNKKLPMITYGVSPRLGKSYQDLTAVIFLYQNKLPQFLFTPNLLYWRSVEETRDKEENAKRVRIEKKN